MTGKIRAGVYNAAPQASSAIDALRSAGFSVDEISVIATEDAVKQHFANYQKEEVVSEHLDEGMAIGSLGGLAIGSFAAIGLATATGVGLVAAGALAAVGIGVGSFAGAMSTRGLEGELADLYDQALTGGDILVAVDLGSSDDDSEARLDDAERILREAGAKPITLGD